MELLVDWLRLGVVQISDYLYNSQVLCISVKGENGYRIVQNFCKLKKSLMDKNTMKDIHECIMDIVRSE
jgi:hypothetical protein